MNIILEIIVKITTINKNLTTINKMKCQSSYKNSSTKLILGGILSSYFEYHSNLKSTVAKNTNHRNTPNHPTKPKPSKNVSFPILPTHLLPIYSFLSFIFLVPNPDSTPNFFQLVVLVSL